MTSALAVDLVVGLGLSLRLEAGSLIVEGARALTESECTQVADNWSALWNLVANDTATGSPLRSDAPQPKQIATKRASALTPDESGEPERERFHAARLGTARPSPEVVGGRAQAGAPASASTVGPYPAAASDTRVDRTLWADLAPDERAAWMAESPEQAAASRDGREPAPVSIGRADQRRELQSAKPELRALPAGLGELDRAALAFWFSLSSAERARSTMEPRASLARLARLEGSAP